MRVIICGAGQVGYNIASNLSREGNEVCVVDVQKSLIARINEELDVKTVIGHASSPDVLKAAGAADADVLIAVTQSDEINMVACQMGHSLFGVPKKIARVREQSYLKPEWSNIFSRAHMPIDVIISPEIIIAQDIYDRLCVPGATFVRVLSHGLAKLVGLVCNEDCPVLGSSVGQIYKIFPDVSFEVVAIIRKNKTIIPDGNELIELYDEVFFISDTHHVNRVMAAFGHEDKEAINLVIAGGGNIGSRLAHLVRDKVKGAKIKIIEKSPQRCEKLSEQLESVIVIGGSALDRDVLSEAGIDKAGVFIAVTNEDESNILCSLLAKQYGCGRVITLVNNEAFSPLVGPLGVDAMVSPRALVTGTVMQHMRRGRIKGLHYLRDGFAEVIEAEVSDTSSIVNTTVAEINLAHEVIVGGVIRDGAYVKPLSKLSIRSGDDVIVLASRAQSHHIERMFSIQVDLF